MHCQISREALDHDFGETERQAGRIQRQPPGHSTETAPQIFCRPQGSLTLECVKAVAEYSDAQMVEQSGELFLPPLPCYLPHTAQSQGHAFPALCRTHVRLRDV